MKKFIYSFSIILLLSALAPAEAENLDPFFEQTDAFLKKYVKDGRVAYKEINSNFSGIESLYKTINAADLSSASDLEKKAFYINAYNLIVIYQVSKYYPLKSALDQSGFFDKVKHTVAGESMTLNALEIKKLILTYKDPRIHFTLACAAVSCPPLASFGYDPKQLDRQLQERTTLALNDPEWLKIRTDQNKVYLSKIFDWYKKDFTMSGESSVLDFINKYRTKKIPGTFKVDYYEYNWSLNES
ncbi:hypothetical protein C900_03812 [Fulvivirga imtechensis AK7]|uniref:DUF547 domain-containing protein n=1 Tax=Fulvivirga imtechensis AK7 TaxID=1237149 RepID=L8JRY1_9BACT|nr:DUF547 domain-containing protein [Fulvivirga imtechensis]ELR70127.1 hypothetical protein C900_03812 [Fulvivirga imtechensis AK7]